MDVSKTLSKPDLHNEWIRNLRTDRVNNFGFKALARLIRKTDLKPGSRVLDAGCGTGTNSQWLANLGYSVTGADFSEFALAQAKGDVEYRREDLTNLTFADAQFDAVFCVGVLMHIPDVEKALEELIRVLKPGGWLVLAESNANAPETYAFRLYWRLAAKHRVERKTCGVEVWSDTSAGPMLSRKASPKWLIGFVTARDMSLVNQMSGELTELYAYGSVLRGIAHALNSLWFRLKGPPAVALGNYYLFRRAD
jgi:SAM-dependent methyltransferase